MWIFLLNTALFSVAFLLLGLLVRKVYRRRVAEPHRREIAAHTAVGDFLGETICEKNREIGRLNQSYQGCITRQWEVLHEKNREIARLKQNVEHLAHVADDRAKALKISRAQIESVTVDRANITKDLYAALNRIDDLEAQLHRINQEHTHPDERKPRKKNRK